MCGQLSCLSCHTSCVQDLDITKFDQKENESFKQRVQFQDAFLLAATSKTMSFVSWIVVVFCALVFSEVWGQNTREDGRCGPNYPAPDGGPAECDYIPPFPTCCTASEHCGWDCDTGQHNNSLYHDSRNAYCRTMIHFPFSS